MKRTKQLSNEDYNGIPLSIPDFLKSHVNKEEKKWYDDKPVVPKSEVKTVEIKSKVGLITMFREVLP
jgi:hypothetical protein